MPFTYEYPHPAVTVDIVIFTVRGDALEVLLIKRAQQPFRGRWALPGGFVNPDESLDEAARRELAEETGVTGAYLEQLYTFGQPDRDPRERVITVSYYALIRSDDIELLAASDATGVGWFDVKELPELAFDHRDILATASARLATELKHSTIALQLMPGLFTLSELQHVYELAGGAPVGKPDFGHRLLASGAIEESGQEKREGPHRTARLYRIIDRHRVDVLG